MIGLMLIGFFVVYLTLSVFVTKKAADWAKANNKKPWLWGGLAAFVMYNLVFWDFIPTLLVRNYYCSSQAGFFIYKTPEQWKNENPDLTEDDLTPLGTYTDRLRDFPYQPLKSNPQRNVLMLNKRLYLDYERKDNVLDWVPIRIHQSNSFIADVNNDERLANLIGFNTGYGNPMTTGMGINAWRFWLSGRCQDPTKKQPRVGYEDYTDYIKEIMKIER